MNRRAVSECIPNRIGPDWSALSRIDILSDEYDDEPYPGTSGETVTPHMKGSASDDSLMPMDMEDGRVFFGFDRLMDL